MNKQNRINYQASIIHTVKVPFRKERVLSFVANLATVAAIVAIIVVTYSYLY